MGRGASLLQRLTASPERLDAAELAEQVRVRDCNPVRTVCAGGVVQVVGRIRSVVYTPSETVPTLQAELFDGTDSMTLVWLGRRRIAGIEPGRRLVAKGRVGVHDGEPAIFNPWYELLCAGKSEVPVDGG